MEVNFATLFCLVLAWLIAPPLPPASSSKEDQELVTVPQDLFDLMRLPPELRRMIYAHMGFFKPQIVRISRIKQGDFTGLRRISPVPIEFHICQETRQLAMVHYQKLQTQGLSQEFFFRGPAEDRLYHNLLYMQPGHRLLGI
jgi:hypothetical protein